MDITNFLQTAMNDQMVDGIANQLGIKNEQAKSAISSALPVLVGALSSNAKKGDSENIEKALDRDHDGSILDNISGFLSGGDFSDGAGILGHILGGGQSNVETAVSKSSGLSSAQTAKLLAILAPIVMGYLGKQKKQGSVASSGGIGGLLEGLVGGMVNSKEADTSILDVLLNQGGKSKEGGLMDIGGKILGGLFGKK